MRLYDKKGYKEVKAKRDRAILLLKNKEKFLPPSISELNYQDFDAYHNIIRIRKTKQKKKVWTPISPQTKYAIKDWIKSNPLREKTFPLFYSMDSANFKKRLKPWGMIAHIIKGTSNNGSIIYKGKANTRIIIKKVKGKAGPFM